MMRSWHRGRAVVQQGGARHWAKVTEQAGIRVQDDNRARDSGEVGPHCAYV